MWLSVWRRMGGNDVEWSEKAEVKNGQNFLKKGKSMQSDLQAVRKLKREKLR